MKTLGERLKSARITLNMTQEQLAQCVNVSRPTISNWERDESQPDFEELYALAQVLRCDFLDYSRRGTENHLTNARKFRLNMTTHPIIEVISDENACEIAATAVDFRIIGRDQRGNPVEIHVYADFCVNSSSE